MNALLRCTMVAFMVFSFAMLGIVAHVFFSGDMQLSVDLVKSISGLVGTLFAIVLGLLVSSSYNAFNAHQADFNELVTTLANIDLLLKKFDFGESKPRDLLYRIVLSLRIRYWPEKSGLPWKEVCYENLSDDVEGMIKINKLVESLPAVPQDDINAVRQFSSSFVTTQSNIIRNLSNQVPSLLLYVVYSWACLLFFLYGCMDGGGGFSTIFLLMGAFAVASTHFLINELTHPYHGLFKVSSAALDLLVASMKKP